MRRALVALSSTLRVKLSPAQAVKERGGRRRGSVYPAASFVDIMPLSSGIMCGENGQSRSASKADAIGKLSQRETAY